MAVMALIPSRPGRADCPSEIAVIDLTERAVSASTPQNLTNDGETRAESIVLDQAEN